MGGREDDFRAEEKSVKRKWMENKKPARSTMPNNGTMRLFPVGPLPGRVGSRSAEGQGNSAQF